jgi:hypothetical protein
VGIIQENAIRSWSALRPRPKVILFGDEVGMTDVAERLDVQLVTDVATNSQGTPLVSDMFHQADKVAAGEVLAFANSDIILTQTIIEAARIAAAWSDKFLLVAQRRDVDVREPIDFGKPGWTARVGGGRLHSPGAIDLFVYRRGQYAGMPPFAIGRTSYDNWLLWKTVASGMPLIDATDYVTLIHQNHDYSHAPNVDVWYGVEARENRKWIQHWSHYYSIVNATWKLAADGQITRATGWRYRMARPRQAFSHALRATRGLRTRVNTWRVARRFGSREGGRT